MIVIVASMEREISALRKVLSSAFRGTPIESAVSIHATGVGRERALSATSSLLDGRPQPECILSLGFAGALRAELSTGDLVISRRLYNGDGPAFIESDARLSNFAQEALEESALQSHWVADTITVPHVISSQNAKETLAQSTTAWITNMEDYWIGTEAIQKGIPFLSVRVVLDPFHQQLPSFVSRLGDVSHTRQWLSVIGNLAVRPDYLPTVLKLSRQVNIAQASLATFGQAFVSRMAAERSGSLI